MIISRILHKISRELSSAATYFENTKKIGSGINCSSETIDKIVYGSIPEIKPLKIKIDNNIDSKIILLIPSLSSGGFFGGVATALIVAAKFAIAKRRNLLIVQTLNGGYINGIEDFYASSNIKISSLCIEVLDMSNRSSVSSEIELLINENDLFIASAWGDAKIIHSLELNNKFLYLVQDYEPIFYPNSDRLIMSKETYRFNTYIPLCNTKFLYDFMVDKNLESFQKHSYWFEPAVSNFKTGIVMENKKKNMFLYGRSNVARNLFFLILLSLKYIFENKLLLVHEWNIYMAGQQDLPDIDLGEGCKITNLGKMEVVDYINFSKSIDVAISLMMAPHPNYPTLEFASIGSAVVTTKYGMKNNLSNYSKNILAAELSQESIVNKILEAASMDYDKRISNLSENNIGDDWNAALDSVIERVAVQFVD